MLTIAKGIIRWSSKGHTILKLQFYTFLEFQYRNKTENDRYWQKKSGTFKAVHFKKKFARSKSYFIANIYQSPFDFHEVLDIEASLFTLRV